MLGVLLDAFASIISPQASLTQAFIHMHPLYRRANHMQMAPRDWEMSEM